MEGEVDDAAWSEGGDGGSEESAGEGLKEGDGHQGCCSDFRVDLGGDSAGPLFFAQVTDDAGNASLRAFSPGGEIVAEFPEQVGFSEEGAHHGGDAVVEFSQSFECEDQVRPGRAFADAGVKCLERDEHFGKRVLEDGEEELHSAAEVDIDGALGTGNGIGNGARGDACETFLRH